MLFRSVAPMEVSGTEWSTTVWSNLYDYCVGAGSAVHLLPEPSPFDFIADDKLALQSDWFVAATDFDAIVRAINKVQTAIEANHSSRPTTQRPADERELVASD